MTARASGVSTLSPAALRSAWCRHQRLGADLAPDARTVLQQMGWVRTLGGVDAYLALHARAPRLTVDGIHGALARRDIEVVPAARGCIYLVARDDAPLARALARDLGAKRTARDLDKAGATVDEVERVKAAILAELSTGPQTTAGLRKRLPEGVVRSLGAKGKKVGLSSTLPPALRQLEFDGRIHRTPIDHQLTHEKYGWHINSDDLASIDGRSAEVRHADLVRRLLGWLAPMSVDQLAAFTGLGKRAVTKALAGEDIVWVDGEEQPKPLAVLAQQLDDIRAPAPDRPVFLPGLDTLYAAHGGPRTFVHPDDADRPIAPWGRQRAESWGHVQHGLSRSIVQHGLICGTWEANPDDRTIAHAPFAPGLPADLDVGHIQHLIWEAVGTANAFSIDNDARIHKRLAIVRSQPAP